jgi:hypothetical protein
MTLLLAFCVAAREPQFERLPSHFAQPYVTVDVLTADNKTHPFLLDTGAVDSYVLDTAAGANGKRVAIRLGTKKTAINGEARVADASRIPPKIGSQPVEGILGLDVIKNLQIAIDYSAETVDVRLAMSPAPAPENSYSVPLTRDTDRLYTIPVSIGPKWANLALDTGASTLLLNFKKLQLPESQAKLPTSRVRTFDGPVESERRLLPSFSIGHSSLGFVVASASPWANSDDGTIGTSGLGSSRVMLDFPGRTLYFGIESPEAQIAGAASRILGVPVRLANGVLVFGGLANRLGSLAGAEIVAVGQVKGADLLAAIRDGDAEGAAAAFRAIRQPGMLTIRRAGKIELLPLQIED